MNFPPYLTIEKINDFIDSALTEDIETGDHSTLATIPESLIQKAKLIVKQDCKLAGITLATYIFKRFDKDLEVELIKNDGEYAKKGEIAFYVSGKARSILSTERLVLNCMQRMSGIATLTSEMTKLLEGTNCKLLDTRKTTPNFRMLEKWSVLIGGGVNHRFGLYDMIMLKDNHIDYNGSISNAVKMTKEYLKKHHLDLKIEVETRNLDEVQEAIHANVNRIMLENMSIDTMKEAVKLINNSCECEASGGITKDNRFYGF